MLSPGDRFEGYVVDAMVGRGGSATVYRAHEASPPGRTVALKILSEHRDGPAELTKLRREFDFAHRLRHPHIIETFTIGRGWLAMAFVDGGTVKNLPTIPNRIAALAQIADALDFIHAEGVVHCDVKPTNILIAQDFYRSGAALVDFGNARETGEGALPHTALITASLPYAPPELLTGEKVSPATDEYALACTAVELITGSPPFTAATAGHLIDAQLHAAPPRTSRHIDWLPTAFDSVLAKAMAKDPARRYRSCAELIALITRIVRD